MSVIKDDLQKWDQSMCKADPDDTAGPGRRADDEVSRRLTMIEVARDQRQEVVVALWDGKQYFDRLPAPGTIRAASVCCFPMPLLALAMQAHRAPRILMCDGVWGHTAASTGRSILPGCSSSPSLARASMFCFARSVKERTTSKCTRFFRHVDDATQLTIHHNKKVAAMSAIDAGIKFAEVAEDVGFTTADKSTLIASSFPFAREVARNLTGRSIPVKVAQVAEDLGVSISGGGRRSVRSLTSRIERVFVRSKCSHVGSWRGAANDQL